MLVKNPTGFNQTLAILKTKTALPLALIAINDRLADGTDVSWLWDVDFEKFKTVFKKVILTGDRAYDMALRLKYAGFKGKTISFIIPEIESQSLKTKSTQIYILPTYTAMLSIRNILHRWGVARASWED